MPTTLLLPSELFNHRPQSRGLELTSTGDYVFFGNVVRLTGLRVVSQDLRFHKPMVFNRGLLTLVIMI